MNITIAINDGNQVTVEQENIKKKIIGKPILVYEYELANHLLIEGFILRKILPNTKTNEGYVFSFHNTEGIKHKMKRWNWARHNQMLVSEDEIIIEHEENEEGSEQQE